MKRQSKEVSEYNNPLFKQCYTGEEWLRVGRHKTIKLLDRKNYSDHWLAKRGTVRQLWSVSQNGFFFFTNF